MHLSQDHQRINHAFNRKGVIREPLLAQAPVQKIVKAGMHFHIQLITAGIGTRKIPHGRIIKVGHILPDSLLESLAVHLDAFHLRISDPESQCGEIYAAVGWRIELCTGMEFRIFIIQEPCLINGIP